MNTITIATKLCGLAMALMISACVYPTSNTQQGGKETAIYFGQPPAGAHVFIDGLDAGPAAQFDGKEAVLAVTPGRHEVEIRVGARAVYEKDIYLGDGIVLKIDVGQSELK